MQSILKTTLIALLFGVSTLQAQRDTTYSILSTADTVAKNLLENEGLHTIYSGLKPISTIMLLDYKIDSVSQEFINPAKVKQELKHLQNSLDLLENDEIGFNIVPFKNVYSSSRTYEVLVYNRTSLRQKIEENADFFLKRGVFSDTPPELIITLYEFGERYERYRAYGYFFGYPQHAVDFFISASREYEATGEFVAREFFQLPVASDQDGRFVYAVPKDHEPNDIDMAIKDAAAQNVTAYRELKDKLQSETNDEQSSFYLELFLQLLANNKREKHLVAE